MIDFYFVKIFIEVQYIYENAQIINTEWSAFQMAILLLSVHFLTDEVPASLT